MRLNRDGYMTILVCILLPILFLGLGLVTFSMLKTRYNHQIKSSCQIQFHGYFSQVRSQIQYLESFNPLAIALYQFQQTLLPFIWIPAVLKTYRAILKIRQRFQMIQNRLIQISNTANKVMSVIVFSQIQKNLYLENRKVRKVLPHNSQMSFQVNPKLQVVKKMNIVFPPYQPHGDIYRRQSYSVVVQNLIHPQSWMKFFRIQKINENYICGASLKVDLQKQLTITYSL